MVDAAIAWLMAHPLASVGGLSVLSVLVGLLLVPRVYELPDRGHPRC